MTAAGRWASPLQEIELAVQDRAKARALDMAGADGLTALRAIIDAEVQRWSEDHKRGLRAFPLADPALVAERAFRNLAGYGPLEPLLDDDDVWEIMINAPDATFPLSRSTNAVTPYAASLTLLIGDPSPGR